VENLLSVLAFNGYIVFFAWILINRLGAPLPATPALVAAGALAGKGEWRIALVLLLAVAATLVSDSIWFALGRRYAGRMLNLLGRTSRNHDATVRVKNFLARHGLRSLLITKFIPGMNRTVLPLTGTSCVGYGRFLMFDFFGALIWAGAYSGIGYKFSTAMEQASTQTGRLGWIAAGLLAMAAVSYVAWKFLRPKNRLSDAAIS
jgi:membrane protein DedA with SNARE-associated domain